jgi:hypothetical protein
VQIAQANFTRIAPHTNATPGWSQAKCFEITVTSKPSRPARRAASHFSFQDGQRLSPSSVTLVNWRISTRRCAQRKQARCEQAKGILIFLLHGVD